MLARGVVCLVGPGTLWVRSCSAAPLKNSLAEWSECLSHQPGWHLCFNMRSEMRGYEERTFVLLVKCCNDNWTMLTANAIVPWQKFGKTAQDGHIDVVTAS